MIFHNSSMFACLFFFIFSFFFHSNEALLQMQNTIIQKNSLVGLCTEPTEGGMATPTKKPHWLPVGVPIEHCKTLERRELGGLSLPLPLPCGLPLPLPLLGGLRLYKRYVK